MISGTRPIQWAVLSIPVVNALADVTTNFFDARLNTGVVRAACLLFIIIIGIVQIRMTAVLLTLYFFLSYALIRALAASNIETSVVENYSKLFVSMMMLPLGFLHLREWHLLKYLHISVLIGGIIIVAQFAIAQVLGLGISVYVEDSFFIGGAKVQTTYWLALAVVVSPLMFAQFRREHRWILGLVLIVFVAVTILVVRRGAILGMIAGVLVYAALSPHKMRTLKNVAVALLGLALAAPLYLPSLLPRVQARSFENRPLETEARYMETFAVANEFVTQPVRHAVFGSEMFNSQQYFGVVRALHVDYNVLLHGGGLTAIALAALLYLTIVMQHRRYNVSLRKTHIWYGETNAVLFGLLAMSLVISLSGSLAVIGYRSTLFLYLGGLLGIQEASFRRLRLFSRFWTFINRVQTPQVASGETGGR